MTVGLITICVGLGFGGAWLLQELRHWDDRRELDTHRRRDRAHRVETVGRTEAARAVATFDRAVATHRAQHDDPCRVDL